MPVSRRRSNDEMHGARPILRLGNVCQRESWALPRLGQSRSIVPRLKRMINVPMEGSRTGRGRSMPFDLELLESS